MAETVKELTEKLVRCRSVTPSDAGAQDILETFLENSLKSPVTEHLDWETTRNLFIHEDRPGKVFCFLGHTDVVPPGDIKLWKHEPFDVTEDGGRLYGRGVADMKGSDAAMAAAMAEFRRLHPDAEVSLAYLVTSDEEGKGTYGIKKVIEEFRKRQQRIDCCLVGEPSSSKLVGDTIKNGRRGSVTAEITFHGTAGHVAYPDKIHNPVHDLVKAAHLLTEAVWDRGNDFMPPTSMQIPNIKGGVGVNNMVPESASMEINWRYSSETSAAEIRKRTEEILASCSDRFEAEWDLSGEPFLSTDGTVLEAARRAIREIKGFEPVLSTGGGTSDGRFMAKICPDLIELGPTNGSIHKIDENIGKDELDELERIYLRLLENLFAR